MAKVKVFVHATNADCDISSPDILPGSLKTVSVKGHNSDWTDTNSPCTI